MGAQGQPGTFALDEANELMGRVLREAEAELEAGPGRVLRPPVPRDAAAGRVGASPSLLQVRASCRQSTPAPPVRLMQGSRGVVE